MTRDLAGRGVKTLESIGTRAGAGALSFGAAGGAAVPETGAAGAASEGPPEDIALANELSMLSAVEEAPKMLSRKARD
jgi:hypothetical protein